jgi:hypothetical protein
LEKVVYLLEFIREVKTAVVDEYSLESAQSADEVKQFKSNLLRDRKMKTTKSDRNKSLYSSIAHIYKKSTESIINDLILYMKTGGGLFMLGLFQCFGKNVETYIEDLENKKVLEPSHFDVILLALVMNKIIRVSTADVIFCYDASCFSVSANIDKKNIDELAFTSEEWFIPCEASPSGGRKSSVASLPIPEVNVLWPRAVFLEV